MVHSWEHGPLASFPCIHYGDRCSRLPTVVVCRECVQPYEELEMFSMTRNGIGMEAHEASDANGAETSVAYVWPTLESPHTSGRSSETIGIWLGQFHLTRGNYTTLQDAFLAQQPTVLFVPPAVCQRSISKQANSI